MPKTRFYVKSHFLSFSNFGENAFTESRDGEGSAADENPLRDLREVDVVEAFESRRRAVFPLQHGERFLVPMPGRMIRRYVERYRRGYGSDEIRDAFYFSATIEHARHEKGCDFDMAT